MSENEMVGAIARVVERAINLLSEDQELRTRLRELARQVLERPEAPAKKEGYKSAEDEARKAAPAEPPVAVDVTKLFRGPQLLKPAAPHILGPRAVPPDPVESLVARFGQPSADASNDELPLIESRCRMKAEGARWAAQRQRLLAEGADHKSRVQPTDWEVIDKAKKLADCFLWTNHPDFRVPSDLAQLDELGGCFEACAEAITLVRFIRDSDHRSQDDLAAAFNLLAEAQSALRIAVGRITHRQDNDQLRAYFWLRAACAEHGVYVERYMRMEDAASPGDWKGVVARASELRGQRDAAKQRDKRFDSSLKKIRHHARQISDDPAGRRSHDWDVVVETVERLVADGMPPSNAELRELLLPLVERVPEMDLPPGFSRVLREIDRYQASRTEPTADDDTEPETSPEVRAVAELLRGKVVVLIGGVRRPKAHAALRRAFELAEVDWVETREHESVSAFEPHVARPDVALVILAIRWSSHSYGDVGEFCERYGKPLVRLPAGYNPNQVAVQVLRQCANRLSPASPVTI